VKPADLPAPMRGTRLAWGRAHHQRAYWTGRPNGIMARFLSRNQGQIGTANGLFFFRGSALTYFKTHPLFFLRNYGFGCSSPGILGEKKKKKKEKKKMDNAVETRNSIQMEASGGLWGAGARWRSCARRGYYGAPGVWVGKRPRT